MYIFHIEIVEAHKTNNHSVPIAKWMATFMQSQCNSSIYKVHGLFLERRTFLWLFVMKDGHGWFSKKYFSRANSLDLESSQLFNLHMVCQHFFFIFVTRAPKKERDTKFLSSKSEQIEYASFNTNFSDPNFYNQIFLTHIFLQTFWFRHIFSKLINQYIFSMDS